MLHVLQKAEDLTEKTTTFFGGYQIGVYTAYVRREDADPKLVHQLLVKVKDMDEVDRSKLYAEYLARPTLDQVVVEDILEDVECFENEFRKRKVYKAYMRNPNADPKLLKPMIVCLRLGGWDVYDAFCDYIKSDAADVEVIEEMVSVVEQFFCGRIEEFYRFYLSQPACDRDLMNQMLAKVRQDFSAADRGCFYGYYMARIEVDTEQVRLIFDDIKKTPHIFQKYPVYQKYLFSPHAEANVIQGKLNQLDLANNEDDGDAAAFYLTYLTAAYNQMDAAEATFEPVQVTDFVKSDAGLLALQMAVKELAEKFAYDAMILWEMLKYKHCSGSVKKAG